MQHPILVPLDGSPTAEDALPMAAALARRREAPIELMLVREPAADPMTIHASATAFRARDESERAAALHYLRGVGERLRAGGVADVRTTVVDGEVVSAIRTRAEDGRALLIAMCTHGRGGWSRFWLGSVAQELIRRVQFPLLLTRPHGEDDELATPPSAQGPSRVLVTLDGSVFAERALDAAVSTFGTDGVDYTLLRIVRSGIVDGHGGSPTPPDPAVEEARRDHAAEYLDAVAERLREDGITARPVTLARKHVAAAIAEYAVESVMDVVAIATHARRGMPRLIVGSVADKVLRASPVPVLMYRPPLDEAAPVDEPDTPAIAIPPIGA